MLKPQSKGVLTRFRQHINLRRGLAVTMLAVFALVQSGYAKDLGVVGKVYPIAEKSALEEIKERAANIDWGKHLSKIKPEDYRPANKVSLPRATKPSVRMIDMTYTLDMDIPDGKGGILYPRGYTFNPLDYISYPRTIVVINAKDKAQSKWFATSGFAQRADVLLMITDGAFVDVIKNTKRPVYYADSRITDKFKIRSLPSVVKQSGRAMEVTEYVVKGR